MSLLQAKGYKVDEESLVAALEDALPSNEAPTASLSAPESDYLRRYSGLEAASQEQRTQLDARRVAAVTTEVARSLDRSSVAALLGISPSRVSHRQAEGALYAFSAGSGRSLYPDWQFATGTVLPYLSELLHKLGPDVPAAVVRRFMTTPDPDLVIDGESVSPHDWLLAGGDPSVVVAQAAELGGFV